jgi:hypothetical protein
MENFVRKDKSKWNPLYVRKAVMLLEDMSKYYTDVEPEDYGLFPMLRAILEFEFDCHFASLRIHCFLEDRRTFCFSFCRMWFYQLCCMEETALRYSRGTLAMREIRPVWIMRTHPSESKDWSQYFLDYATIYVADSENREYVNH